MNNPDYVPSVFVFSNATSNNDKRSRYERYIKRHKRQTKDKQIDGEMADLDNDSDLPMYSNATDQEVSDVPSMVVTDLEEGATDEDLENVDNAVSEQTVANEEESIPRKVDKNLSTTIDSTHWHMIEEKMAEQEKLIDMLQFELRATRPSEKLHNDDHQVHFYTGLPTYSVFVSLLNLLVGVMSKHLSHGLSVSDQFLLVLMKLRLAVPNQTLHTDLVLVQAEYHNYFISGLM